MQDDIFVRSKGIIKCYLCDVSTLCDVIGGFYLCRSHYPSYCANHPDFHVDASGANEGTMFYCPPIIDRKATGRNVIKFEHWERDIIN